MAVCTLRVPADTGTVRVARMVAGAAARRVGLVPDDVDEVRQAVGEAVGRAVLRQEQVGADGPISVSMSDSVDSLMVEVTDAAAGATDDDFGLAMAVITGLVPGTEVLDAPTGGQTLRMTWARTDPTGQ